MWNYNLVVDTFMGEMRVPVPGDGDSRRNTERYMQYSSIGTVLYTERYMQYSSIYRYSTVH